VIVLHPYSTTMAAFLCPDSFEDVYEISDQLKAMYLFEGWFVGKREGKCL